MHLPLQAKAICTFYWLLLENTFFKVDCNIFRWLLLTKRLFIRSKLFPFAKPRTKSWFIFSATRTTIKLGNLIEKFQCCFLSLGSRPIEIYRRYRIPYSNKLCRYLQLNGQVGKLYFFSSNSFRHKWTIYAVECSYEKIESYICFIDRIASPAFDQIDYYNFINIAIIFSWSATFYVKKNKFNVQFWEAVRSQWVMSSGARKKVSEGIFLLLEWKALPCYLL